MRFLYNIAILLYYLAIRLASLFNTKAKLWIEGRRDLFKKIKASIKGNEKIIWFHCASLGEFEQGRPVLENFKLQHPGFKILLTFFSPSGYEIRKNYAGADYIFYLPLDTPGNAKSIVDIINPSIVIFVKYEFWFNLLTELKKRNIPVYLISSVFRREQHFFKPLGGFFRKGLATFKHIFVQDENSKTLLAKINLFNVTVAGDTRFDRVYNTSQQAQKTHSIDVFKSNNKILIAGSTWEKDEQLLEDLILNYPFNDLKFIIAPHEISEENLIRLEKKLKGKTIRFSQANEAQLKNKSVLLIDNIGMLSSLYQYGTIAYIGGGFGKGIHNILEAATFGLPVLFGSNYKKFSEAIALIQKSGAFEIRSSKQLKEIIESLLQDERKLNRASEIASDYVKANTGATKAILSHPDINLQ